MEGISTIDKVIDFLSECEKYLHSWACTMTGEYEPLDTRNVREILVCKIADGSKTPIRDFKKGVKDHTISLPICCIDIIEPYRSELYKKHRKNVEEFEKKYNIKDEED